MTWALVVVDMQGKLQQDNSALARQVGAKVDRLIEAFESAGEAIYRVENALDARPLLPGSTRQTLYRYGTDAFTGSGLSSRLRSDGVNCIVLCGAGTDTVIDTTAKRALASGFDVLLVSDAHLAHARGDLSAETIVTYHNALLADWVTPGQIIEVLPAEDILAILSESPMLPAAVGW
ncbi:isochorismatase family protein [Chitinimonas sp. BJYL2]|uniref:isochorismatase family protein n=1 Tax=Chitinimonas sp. BJYL2 TaxID=2976696 RepID=UPI0022B56698|nr:isochorismatase family protein [Chitinimonas sp. BJYL2]